MAVLLISEDRFAPRVIDVPPPTVPPTPYYTGVGPYTNPVYRIAHVDPEGKFSPWSDSLTIPGDGVGVTTRMTDYIPADNNIVGVLWSIDGMLAWAKVDGVEPPNQVWGGVRPDVIYEIGKTTRPVPEVGNSTILLEKPAQPVLVPYGIPNVDLDVAVALVTENGETACGPWCRSSKGPGPETAMGFRMFTLPEFRIPPGAKAYRICAKMMGRCGAFLIGEFAIDMMQPIALTLTTRTHIGQNPTSTLSRLQQALDARQTGDVVIVGVDEDVTVPIIDQFGPERTIIKGKEGGAWTINYTGGGEVALLVQSSYTTYHGLILKGGCRATSNWASGQAFGCEYHDCHFTNGIRTLKTSSRWRGDHTESETLFDDCIIDGWKTTDLPGQAIRLEGPQTASVRFRRCHVHGPMDDRPRGTCAIWIDTEGDRGVVEFEGGLFCDGGYTLIYVAGGSILHAEDIFCDQGAPVIAEGFGYAPAIVVISGNAINAPTYGGNLPWRELGNVRLELVDVPQGNWRTMGMVPA